jgi:hypothetical protein
MSANDETRAYLYYLLEHHRSCESEDCLACRSARKVLELTRELIFSATPYPQVALTGQRKPAHAAVAAGGGRKGSTRRAA